MKMENRPYPLSLRGELTVPPGRGWWLLKWLLGIPHYIILFFLWIAFVFVWIISFFAILFTGKHPKSLFDFKVGVMRWMWRVGFYSYHALGTDKYPPFSFEPDPDYPADLDIPYQETMSRGLVLVKWWLLAIPHYIITGFFVGSWNAGNAQSDSNGVGIILVLAIFSAIAVLFTGNYPGSIFKLVVGFNRWVYRVAAYVFLLTDEYPPFRLWDD